MAFQVSEILHVLYLIPKLTYPLLTLSKCISEMYSEVILTPRNIICPGFQLATPRIAMKACKYLYEVKYPRFYF